MASVNIAQTKICIFAVFIAASLPALGMTAQADEAVIEKLFMNTQFADAINACRKALKEHPQDRLRFLNKIAEMEIASPRGTDGLIAAREAAKLAPKNAQVIATCSILEFLASYVVKAQQMAQEAIALDDKNGRAHAALALSGLRDESIPMAAELAKAIKLAPKDATVLTVAGIIHLRKLEYDQAEASYSLMVKNFPNTALPYYLRGFFRREVFNNPGAIKDFNEVIKHYPGDSHVITSRAKLNKKTGHFKEAIEDFNRLEKLSGGKITSYGRRAECYEALNQYEPAIKDYKKALDQAGVMKPGYKEKFATSLGSTRRSAWTQMMDPKDAALLSSTKATWLKLIILEEKHGDYDDAIKQLNQFTTAFPGDLNSIHVRHTLFKKMGRWNEALGDINLLISKNPNVSDYYVSRADIYKHLNKPDRVAEDLKRVHNLETTGTVTGD